MNRLFCTTHFIVFNGTFFFLKLEFLLVLFVTVLYKFFSLVLYKFVVIMLHIRRFTITVFV